LRGARREGGKLRLKAGFGPEPVLRSDVVGKCPVDGRLVAYLDGIRRSRGRQPTDGGHDAQKPDPRSPVHAFLLRWVTGPAAPALSPANCRQHRSWGHADLLLAQRSPDVRAQMHEALQIHNVLNALMIIPSLAVAHIADVEDFLDAAWTPG